MMIIHSLLFGSFRKQILWEFGKSTVIYETCHLILSVHTSFWASRINVWLEWILSRFTTHWIFHFHCFSWWVVILLPVLWLEKLLSVSAVMVSHCARCVSGAVVFCWAFGILLKFTTAPRKRYKITASFLCVWNNSVCEKVCADAKRPFLISLSNCIAITVLHK